MKYVLKHARMIAFILPLGFLVACTGGAQQTGLMVSSDAAAVAGQVLSPADVANLNALCTSAAPMLQTAVSAGPARVSGTAIYGAAFCQKLAAGGPPVAHLGASSMAWLPKVISGMQTAAQVAGVLLPALLPLL